MNELSKLSPRDTTVAGLIKYLQEQVEMMPEIAEYLVWMEAPCDVDCNSSLWHGTSFRNDESKYLQLEST